MDDLNWNHQEPITQTALSENGVLHSQFQGNGSFLKLGYSLASSIFFENFPLYKPSILGYPHVCKKTSPVLVDNPIPSRISQDSFLPLQLIDLVLFHECNDSFGLLTLLEELQAFP